MKPASQVLYSGNFDGFEMIMNIVIAVDRFGHTLGHQLVSALLFFVPRELWGARPFPAATTPPRSSATTSPTSRRRRRANSTSTSPASGSSSAPWPSGYVYRKADTVYAASLAFGGITLHRILAAMLCGFTVILLRGALLAVIALIATSFAAIAFLVVAPRIAAFFTGRSVPKRLAAEAGGSPRRRVAPPPVGTADGRSG